MKLLRSFEDLIFEAATWLLLYPRTLFLAFLRPLSAMAYSDREQEAAEDVRYDDAISPPMFLLLTVVLVNFIGVALHVPPPPQASAFTKLVLDSPQNAALFRSLIFSLLPLVAAAMLLRRQGVRVSRKALRAPFYAQCYVSGPFALLFGLGNIILQRSDISNDWAGLLVLAGVVWLGVAETRWFASRLQLSWVRALGLALASMVLAACYLLAVLIPIATLL